MNVKITVWNPVLFSAEFIGASEYKLTDIKRVLRTHSFTQMQALREKLYELKIVIYFRLLFFFLIYVTLIFVLALFISLL